MYVHNQIKTYSQKEATFTGSLSQTKNKLTTKKNCYEKIYMLLQLILTNLVSNA